MDMRVSARQRPDAVQRNLRTQSNRSVPILLDLVHTMYIMLNINTIVRWACT